MLPSPGMTAEGATSPSMLVLLLQGHSALLVPVWGQWAFPLDPALDGISRVKGWGSCYRCFKSFLQPF